jgi:hypothetical protein
MGKKEYQRLRYEGFNEPKLRWKTQKPILTCPIRGTLKASGRSKDGLSPSEEAMLVGGSQIFAQGRLPKGKF